MTAQQIEYNLNVKCITFRISPPLCQQPREQFVKKLHENVQAEDKNAIDRNIRGSSQFARYFNTEIWISRQVKYLPDTLAHFDHFRITRIHRQCPKPDPN